MAKLKRVVLGEILKAKDDKNPDYIKLKDGAKLPSNGIIRVETKAYQLKSLDAAVAAGRMNADMAEEMKAGIEKRAQTRVEKFGSDFVRAELTVLEDQN